jgi:lipopolysaccharide export system permease protein
MKKTIYLYLLREILPSFLLGLVGITFVLLTGRILQLAELFVNKGIGLGYILTLLYFLLPTLLVLTIPMSTLLSVLLAFNRLSSDNEITAMKASGVSLYQLTPPVIFFAAFTYVATSLLAIYALPYANQASRSLLFELASSKANAGIKERVFNDDFEGLVLYVEHVVPQTFQWENVFISDSRDPAQANTIIARDGTVLSDPQKLTVVLRLTNGAIHRLGEKPDAYQKIDFQTYDLRLDLKADHKGKGREEKNPADMSLGELNRSIQKLRASNGDAKTQMIKIHEKFSIPFACMVFGIIAIPLGMQARSTRTAKSMGFAWSIGVLLVYYLLTNAGTSLAERGIVLLEAGMWTANAVFLALSIYLLVKAANESPVLLFVLIGKAAAGIRRWAGSWRSPR